MEDKHEYECLICLDEVDDEYTYVKCHNCNKLFHEDCMLTWKYKQKKRFSVCVHCTKDDLLLHKTTVTCCTVCCFPLSWKKNKSMLKKEVTNFD